MTLNTDPRCKAPQMCRRSGMSGICINCRHAWKAKERASAIRLAADEMEFVAAQRAAAPRPAAKPRLPNWCPEELGDFYATTLLAMQDKAETRRIIEDHMRIRRIPAPGVGV